MITLAPINVTQGETSTIELIYLENGVGFNFTGWTGSWEIVQDGATVTSWTLTLTAVGGISWQFTAAKIEALDLPDQHRGRALANTRWIGTATKAAETMTFTAAVIVNRAVEYRRSQWTL